MDGTLIDSTPGVEATWELFAETYPTINVKYILESAYSHRFHPVSQLTSTTDTHGVRTVETLRRFCGITDPEKLAVTSPTLHLAKCRPANTALVGGCSFRGCNYHDVHR
jgi:hypothetical protein